MKPKRPDREKRAAIYVRVSSSQQELEGTSLDTQAERCRQFAREKGYAVLPEHTYCEVHSGADLHERRQLGALRTAARDGEIDAVISFAVDRLSRNQAHVYILAEEMENQGIDVLFVTEEFENSAVGKFLRSAKAFAAEVEREKFRERSQRGRLARAQAGMLIPSRTPLYGYQWADERHGRYVENPSNGIVVRRIFAEYIQGQSLRSIAASLSAGGILAPRGGAIWDFVVVSKIVSNPAYKGEAYAFTTIYERRPGATRKRSVQRPRDEWVALPEGTIPPLVDDATFAAAQERLRLNQERSPRRTKDPERYLLRGGYVKCGYCGYTMVAHRKVSRKSESASYECVKRSRSTGLCSQHGISTELLDSAVWERVGQLLTHPEVIAGELRQRYENDPTEADLDGIQRALVDITRKRSNLSRSLAMFDDADAATPIVDELKMLASQQKSLETERERIATQHANWLAGYQRVSDLESWCSSVAGRLQGFTYVQRRLALDALGVGVRVWKVDHAPRYEISASIPLAGKSPEDQTGQDSFLYAASKNIHLSSSEVISPAGLTLIVGPNNAGKTRLLRDIKELCTSHDPRTVVVQRVEHTRPSSYGDLRESYNIDLHTDASGNRSLRALNADLTGAFNQGVGVALDWEQSIDQAIQTWSEVNQRHFANMFGHYFLARLTTENRLQIAKSSASGDVRADISNLMQALYRDGSRAAATISDLVRPSFGVSLYLDFSSLGILTFRVGEDFSEVPPDPRDARAILEEYERLDDQGDGIQSFTATVMALVVGAKPVLLIDEPEAFLHPPQAFDLGQIIADRATNERQTLVATHSVDLLRGILSQRTDIQLLRLSRANQRWSVSLLDPSDVAQLVNDPLLSSTRMLDGLFYRGVVLVEADSDAAFYRRVARSTGSRDDIHYVHTHGKGALHKAAAAYQRMGVKYSVVVDFDILRDRDDLTRLWKACTSEDVNTVLALQELIRAEIEGVALTEHRRILIEGATFAIEAHKADVPDSAEINELRALRRELRAAIDKADAWDPYKRAGRAALSPKSQTVFDQLDALCRARGIYIVSVGELESWLEPYGLEPLRNKTAWISQALGWLSSNTLPASSQLLSFVRAVHAHALSDDAALPPVLTNSAS